MKNYRVMGIVLAMLLVCLAGTVRAENLITNGNFDGGIGQGWWGTGSIGWNPTGGPDGGSAYVDGGVWFVSPETTSHLVAGQAYKVSFYAALLTDPVSDPPNPDARVLISNTDGSQGNVDNRFQLALNDWQQYNYQFTATAQDVTTAVHVNFLNSLNQWTSHTGASPCRFGIDSVSLTAVPEPSTIVLLSLGLLGLSAYAWRKRK